jgi:epoxyqueuosine reductase
MDLSKRLKRKAAELGFNRVGIIPAYPSPTLDAYLRWIDADMHGKMNYLAREDRVSRRHDLRIILPNIKSLIIVALDYTTLTPPDNIWNDPTRGRISNYAWGVDYHNLMTPRLDSLAAWLAQEIGEDIQQQTYVDTGAILERSHAQQAGLGFIGKNTMLIHPRAGSTFFLGELLTTIDFGTDAYDKSHRETMCGSCTRCLVACPTDAFPQPYMLDARRCISYLTIELKDTIPENLRPLMGNWVYGCDVCQEVCPWNRFAVETLETDFFPTNPDDIAPKLQDLLHITDDSFAERFYGSPIKRIKRERFVRNVCVAAGNSNHRGFLPILERLATEDKSSLVQAHAAWAIDQLQP